MAIPEYIYRGATLYITGRVLDNVNVTGWVPYLKIGDGTALSPVSGVWSNPEIREFFFVVTKDKTALLAEGPTEYEIYISLPSGEEFVVSRGSFDVISRL